MDADRADVPIHLQRRRLLQAVLLHLQLDRRYTRDVSKYRSQSSCAGVSTQTLSSLNNLAILLQGLDGRPVPQALEKKVHMCQPLPFVATP